MRQYKSSGGPFVCCHHFVFCLDGFHVPSWIGQVAEINWTSEFDCKNRQTERFGKVWATHKKSVEQAVLLGEFIK